MSMLFLYLLAFWQLPLVDDSVSENESIAYLLLGALSATAFGFTIAPYAISALGGQSRQNPNRNAEKS